MCGFKEIETFRGGFLGGGRGRWVVGRRYVGILGTALRFEMVLVIGRYGLGCKILHGGDEGIELVMAACGYGRRECIRTRPLNQAGREYGLRK